MSLRNKVIDIKSLKKLKEKYKRKMKTKRGKKGKKRNFGQNIDFSHRK